MTHDIVLKTAETPAPIPDGLPFPDAMPASLALNALREALDAGVAIAAKKEDAKTQRALIRAQAELNIKSMELATRQGMAKDRDIHEQRMELIDTVGKLLVDNARVLTPEILSAANMLLVQLREIK